MKKSLLIILIIASAFILNAQDTDLSTPYKAIELHLSNLQKGNNNPGIAVRALKVNDYNNELNIRLAKKLKKILDGRQLFVNMEKVPNEPNYIDSITGEAKYVLFENVPQIYLKKYGKQWQYSSETVSMIPDLYEETYPFTIDELKDRLPEFAFDTFLGLYVWQYMGMAIYLIGGLLLFFLFSWLFGYVIIRIIDRFIKTDVLDKYIKPLARPLSALIVVVIIEQLIPTIELPIKLGIIVGYLLKALFPAIITLIAFRLTDLFSDVMALIASKTKTTVDDNLIPLLRKAVKIIVVVLGGIYVIENVGIPVTPVLAGVSIGGLAFALAAQDTIKNFFGSLTIFADQPFDVGDWIVFEGSEGMVEEVGVRSTRVRTFYNSLISIPNGKLADTLIDNMGRRKYRRYSMKISITYDTPPKVIEAFVDGLRKIVNIHPKTWKDYYQIHLNEFASTSLNVLFYIFFEVPDWAGELEARHEINMEIIKLAESLGVRFAFPTNTLHVETFPNTTSLTPKYNEPENFYGQKMEQHVSDRQKHYQSLNPADGENTKKTE